MRFLRRAREILLRDLGGLVYEVHRSAGAGDRARHEALVAGKVERLRLLDAELLELGSALGDVRGEFVVRQPGVGGACRACGELHGSDARFCSRCGARLDGSGAAPRAAEGATTGDAAGRDGGARGSEAREDRGVPRDRAADDATPNRAIERDAPPDDASGTAPDRAPGDEAPSQGAGDAPDSENRRAYPVASTPEERR